MRNLKRNLGRYVGIGIAVLLVLAALYLPQVWFALRDAASQSRVQGEALVPLTVAQLDRSYERDIYERMCAFMEAYAKEDVNCSTKEIDPETESLWENIRQSETCILLEALRDAAYMTLSEEKGWDSVIESCTQYVLMRQSDGQILLVANDICLDRGDGCRQELLIDGVDGTVYYLYSEETGRLPSLWEWVDFEAWNWWWILNDTYHTETAKTLEELYFNLEEDTTIYIDAGRAINKKTGEQVGFYDPESGRIFGYPEMMLSSSVDDVDTCCCLLDFGQTQSGWSMEIDAWGRKDKSAAFLYQIRLGLPGVVNSIPEMKERISLPEYDQINHEEVWFQITNDMEPQAGVSLNVSYSNEEE